MQFSEDQITQQLGLIFASTHNAETDQGIGDDCAVILSSSKTTDQRVLISTDVLVEGQHFKSTWSTPEEIANRAFAQNLADIAASGGRGTTMVIAITLPDALDFQWLRLFAVQFAKTAQEQGVAVVGGDLSKGEQLAITVTVFGTVDGENVIGRNGAEVGNIVALAGEIGLSNIGLNILSNSQTPTTAFQKLAVERYKCPAPPYQSGVEARKNGASAMMDVSDGLIKDATRLANSSGVTIELLPFKDVEIPYKSDISMQDYYLGGEDHCLLATFPNSAALPSSFVAIGKIVEKQAEPVISEDLRELSGAKMWDHFGGVYV